MNSTSDGYGSLSGLFVTAALTTLTCVTSYAHAADQKPSEAATVLTCPEKQGQLKRLSASRDGTFCAYSYDDDKTFHAALQLVKADQNSPAEYMDILTVLIYGIDSNTALDVVKNYGIKLDEDIPKSDSHKNITDYHMITYPDSNRLGFRSIGVAIRGPRTGPLAIAILTSKDHTAEAVTEDFVNLFEFATASWVKPTQSEPSHSPDRLEAYPHRR